MEGGQLWIFAFCLLEFRCGYHLIVYNFNSTNEIIVNNI